MTTISQYMLHQNSPRLKKSVLVFLLASVLAINFAFGFPRLSTFSAVDEPYWFYGRITKFWNAVATHKWKSTSVNDKPGITVAIISGAGLSVVSPMDYKDIRGNPKTIEQTQAIMRSNFWLRLPMFLVTLLGIAAFFFLLHKLFDEEIALISTVFIGLSPILLGISLIVNPDSLLWIFLPLSLLSYLVFQKVEQKKYLYSAGIFLGLALLTKYVANVLYVFLFGLLFLEYILNDRVEKHPLLYLKKALSQYSIIVLTSMAVFFVLYPATWVSPSMLLKGTFLSKAFVSTWPLFAGIVLFILFDFFLLKGKVIAKISDFLSRYKTPLIRAVSLFVLLSITFVFLNTFLGMHWSDFQATLASPKSGTDAKLSFSVFTDNFFADFFALIFGLTPLVLLFFLVALVNNARKVASLTREHVIVFYFSLFILLYYVASTVNHVGATVRYQIILYPLAAIIAAIGARQLLHTTYLKRFAPPLLAAVLFIIISFVSLYQVRPFFFSYASTLLPSRYTLNLKDMGDGSYEAAQYLNSLPNAHALSVWSDKGAVCETFVGDCSIGLTKKKWQGHHFDYFVSSTGRRSRSLKMSGGVNSIADMHKVYAAEGYVFKIQLDGRPDNFVKVIRGDEVYK